MYQHHTGHYICGGKQVTHCCHLHRAMSVGATHSSNHRTNECKLSSAIHFPKEKCGVWKCVIREFELSGWRRKEIRPTLMAIVGVTQAREAEPAIQAERTALAKTLWQEGTGCTQDTER